MGKRLQEVDAYIDNSQDFAKPILKKLRRLFHKASPTVDEVIKWGCPHFESNGLVGGIAGFKKHVTLGFWKSKQMKDPAKLFQRGPKASMCTIRMESTTDMPADALLIDYMQAAIQLNAQRATLKKTASPKKLARPRVPAILTAALNKSQKARSTFDGFSPSSQREYVEWITEAKREETKVHRAKQAVEWLAEGKRRNWKYER